MWRVDVVGEWVRGEGQEGRRGVKYVHGDTWRNSDDAQISVHFSVRERNPHEMASASGMVTDWMVSEVINSTAAFRDGTDRQICCVLRAQRYGNLNDNWLVFFRHYVQRLRSSSTRLRLT